MKVHRNLLISGSRKKPITFDVYVPSNMDLKGVIIFSHGFKGFKDWGTFDSLAKYFASRGYVYLKFNFSFNGTMPDDLLNFCDLEAFGHNTYSTEMNDLGLMIDWVSDEKETLNYGFAGLDINIMGHSRGGGITLAKASEDNRVQKAITLAAVHDFGRGLSEPMISEWKKKGVQYIMNGRTKQNMPLYYSLYEDYMENQDRLNLEKRIPYITIPLLVAHGTQDEAVPESSARKIHELCPHSELLLIKDANHVFGGSHPWERETLPDDLQLVASRTLSFLNKE